MSIPPIYDTPISENTNELNNHANMNLGQEDIPSNTAVMKTELDLTLYGGADHYLEVEEIKKIDDNEMKIEKPEDFIKDEFEVSKEDLIDKLFADENKCTPPSKSFPIPEIAPNDFPPKTEINFEDLLMQGDPQNSNPMLSENNSRDMKSVEDELANLKKKYKKSGSKMDDPTYVKKQYNSKHKNKIEKLFSDPFRSQNSQISSDMIPNQEGESSIVQTFLNHSSVKKNYSSKKNTYKTYADLISTLQHLSKFDWLESTSPNSKFLPGRFLTPIVVWFMLNSSYFPRAPFIKYTPADYIEQRKDKLRTVPLVVPQRINKSLLKTEAINKPTEDNESQKFSVLQKKLRQHLDSFDRIAIENKTMSERKHTISAKSNYTTDDDAWLLSNKIAVFDYLKSHVAKEQEPNDEDFEDEVLLNSLTKVDLQDMINIYEHELYDVLDTNDAKWEILKDKMTTQIDKEKFILENNLVDPNDVLVDLRVKLLEEDQFLSMLEKRQSELKEQVKVAPTGKGKEVIPTPQQQMGGLKMKKPRVILEDMVCQICNDGDYAEDDLIVFCARCNISVHQRCYGIPKIPNDDWICEVCQNFGNEGRYLRCPLCSKRGGAMKRTTFRCDTPYFANLNPVFHDYIQSYCYTKDFTKPLTKQVSKQRPDAKEITIIKSMEEIPKEKEHEEGDTSATTPNQPSSTLELKKELLMDPDNKSNDYEDKLYYDFHFIDDNYTELDLKNEPRPEYLWVHMTCVMFIPELYFGDKLNMNEVEGFNCLAKDRFKIECIVCQKKNGAIINCDKGQCKKAFHPECARRAKLFLDVREVENTQQMGYAIFCEKHTPLKLRRTLETKEKKYRDELTKFCKSIEKYYFTYVHELKGTSNPDLDGLTDDQAKLLLKKKKNKMILKDDASYFIKLVEGWRAKVPSQLSTITLQRVPIKDQAEQKDGYILLDTSLAPKSAYLSTRRLTPQDELWNRMPYKHLTPDQKFKKYKKLLKMRGKRIALPNLTKFIKKALTKSQSHKQKNREKEKAKKGRGPGRKKLDALHKEDDPNNLYCLCRKPYLGEFMIACEICDAWYHPECVRFPYKNEDASKIKWLCPHCENKNKSKKRKNPFAGKANSEEPKIKKQLKKNQSNPPLNPKISKEQKESREPAPLNESIELELKPEEIPNISSENTMELENPLFTGGTTVTPVSLQATVSQQSNGRGRKKNIKGNV
jgi:bromodomain and PHD finger-containing protein 1